MPAGSAGTAGADLAQSRYARVTYQDVRSRFTREEPVLSGPSVTVAAAPDGTPTNSHPFSRN